MSDRPHLSGADKPGALGEFDLIHRFFAPLATAPGALGLLDDAALFDLPDGHSGVVTTDAMVAGVHFFQDDAAYGIGWKLLAVNLSDLAAMGAVPIGYTLDLALQPGWTAHWVEEFAAGLRECQGKYAISLLGGDTVSIPGPVTVAITAFGAVPRGTALLRSGARPGDSVWVSGTVGDAALAVRLRKGWTPSSAVDTTFLDRRLDLPEPRLALGQALRGLASAAADVSDGLVADLGHICAASQVSAELHLGDVPLSATVQAMVQAEPDLARLILAGGDDYELVFTAPAEAESAIREAARGARTSVARIGRIESGSGVRVLDPGGLEIVLDRLGFAHF